MADEKIFVVDRVVTKAGCARAFVDKYIAEYAPGGSERGMTLDRILVSPPIWSDDETNVVTITWTVDGVESWWQMTRQAGGIPTWAGGGREWTSWSSNARAPWPPSLTMSKGFPMYNVIRVVHFAEATDASDRAEYIETVRIAVKELGALRQLVAPTLPGVINGGDALVHLHFPRPRTPPATPLNSTRRFGVPSQSGSTGSDIPHVRRRHE